MTRIRTQLLLGVCSACRRWPPARLRSSLRPVSRTTADQPAVTFRVEINYVEVDAAVFDRQGRFVNDLARDDFQVLEEGVPQDVSAFSLVNIPIERAERPLFARNPIEPDVASNATPFEGRVYVLVLDDLQTAPLRSRWSAARRGSSSSRRWVPTTSPLSSTRAAAARPDRSSPATSGCCSASVDRFMGRKLRSTTLERLDQYQRQRGIPAAEQRAGEPHQRSARSGTRPRRPGVARCAQEHQRIRGRHPRAAESDRVPERGHRLRHLRLQQSRVHDDSGRDAVRSSRRPRGRT